MTVRAKRKRLAQDDIDQVVVMQADDDSAWEKPIRVHQAAPASLSIPAELAARAAFLARLHREPGVEQWLRRIIRERIELEEVAFVEAKRDLARKRSR
jgi:hypothetical protein